MERSMNVVEAPNQHSSFVADAAPLLLISAKLFTVEGRMVVTLLDMTADYAVAAATTPPPAGSIAVLSRCGVRASATVAWVDGQRIGLTFDRALPAALLEQLAG
jgi:hypothetical protein